MMNGASLVCGQNGIRFVVENENMVSPVVLDLSAAFRHTKCCSGIAIVIYVSVVGLYNNGIHKTLGLFGANLQEGSEAMVLRCRSVSLHFIINLF